MIIQHRFDTTCFVMCCGVLDRLYRRVTLVGPSISREKISCKQTPTVYVALMFVSSECEWPILLSHFVVLDQTKLINLGQFP